MTRTEYKINFHFEFDPTHKGAPYTLDGEHYMNGGEFAEVADKMVKGFGSKKDANTPFDKGSDIEETNTSVKSSKATLTSAQIGYDFHSIKRCYFERVHSNNWDYVVIIDNTVVIYNMNKVEFESFLDNWSGYCKDRNTIRIKATSGKMIRWFDERVA
jgi:hypothetical protein